MSEENKTLFEVGDIVDWCGAQGIIRDIKSPSDSIYRLMVKFENGYFEWFTGCGRIKEWHLEPSLKLIEKAKKKVKKKFWFVISDSLIKARYFSAQLYTNPIKHTPDCQLVEIELEVEE